MDNVNAWSQLEQLLVLVVVVVVVVCSLPTPLSNPSKSSGVVFFAESGGIKLGVPVEEVVGSFLAVLSSALFASPAAIGIAAIAVVCSPVPLLRSD